MSRFRWWLFAGVVGLMLAAGGVAVASWVVTVASGSNFAAATAQILPTGATPTVTVSPVSSQTPSISFAKASTSGGTAVTAYNVTRYAVGSSSGTAISGTCSIVSSTVTCTDTPGSGSWQYTDVPAIASSSWVGTESVKSTAVVVQALTTTTATVPASVTVNTAVTPSATLSGATTSPAPTGSISFSVFGPQSSAPSLCGGAGWSAVGTAVTITADGAYTASAAFTPVVAGTYWWETSYNGDTHNAGSSSACASNSTVVHLALSPSTLPFVTVYAAYSQTITASGGTSPYTFALTSGALPTGLSLSAGGTLSGTISASGQSGTFNFTVTGTDHAGLTGSTAYTLTVNGPPISLSALSITMTLATKSYAPATLTASGGTSPYTFTVNSGALPSGVTLSSGGVLAGSPGAVSASTVYNFTVGATDANSYTGSQAYALTVVPILTSTPLGSGSCALVTVGSCSTSSVSTTNGATELVLIYTTGTLNPTISSVTGPFTSSASPVDSTSFSSGILTGNKVYAYAATGNGTSGAVTANFGASLLSTTAIDVVQLAGNATGSAIVQHTSTNGSSSPVKSTFSGAPAAFNGEVVFAAAPGTTTLTPTPTSTVSVSGLTLAVYVLDPSATSQSFTMGSSGPWGTVGMEFAHN